MYLKIFGSDAQSFLQAQASNSVLQLNQGQGSYCAFLNPQSKIQALSFVYKLADDKFVLICKNSENLKQHLSKFIILENVEIAVLETPPAEIKAEQIALEDFTEGDTLMKLDLVDKYVDFSKGCFPGQEPISKYKNIGLKKKEERSRNYTDEALEIFTKAQNNDSDLDPAIELLRKALKENSKNEDAYESLGVMLAKQEKYQEAIQVMQQLELLNPQNQMAQMNLSIFYMKIGDKEKAEEHKAKGTVLQFETALKE